MSDSYTEFTLTNNRTHRLKKQLDGALKCEACQARISWPAMREGPVYLPACKGKKR